MIKLQSKLQTAYSEFLRIDIERIKTKLSKLASVKTLGTIIRSRVRWYEYGEKNSKYFYNLEKTNQRKKTYNGPKSQWSHKINRPERDSWRGRALFLNRYMHQKTRIRTARSLSNSLIRKTDVLSEETATICEGIMSIDECKLCFTSDAVAFC